MVTFSSVLKCLCLYHGEDDEGFFFCQAAIGGLRFIANYNGAIVYKDARKLLFLAQCRIGIIHLSGIQEI